MGMRSVRGVAALVAGLVLLVGLAGPSAARTQAPSDRAIDAAGLLRRADVPAGWRATQQPDDGAGEYAGITGCQQLVHAINALRQAAPHRRSPTFRDDRSPHELTSASDLVYALPSSRAGAAAVARFRGAPVETCLLNAAKKGGGKQSQVAATVIPSGAGPGVDAVGYEVTLRASDVAGAPVTGVFDTEVVRIGRAVVGFDFTNQDTPLAQAPAIVRAVVERLRAVRA